MLTSNARQILDRHRRLAQAARGAEKKAANGHGQALLGQVQALSQGRAPTAAERGQARGRARGRAALGISAWGTYSTRLPALASDAQINQRTGRFAASWVLTVEPGIRGAVMTLRNVSPEAVFLAAGTSRMRARPLLGAARRQAGPPGLHLAAAMRQAQREAR